MTNTTKLMRGLFVALALLVAPVSGVGGVLYGASAAQAQEQRLIAAVLFEGNSGFSDAQLLAMVNVAARGSFTEESAAADAESIRLAYVGKGYVGVTVTPRFELAENGRTRIIFVVNEGDRTGIAAINFTGNNTFNAGTLKSVIRTRETHLLSWLFRDDTYSDQGLAIDKEMIRLYYANHGFPDAVVTSAVGEYDSARNAYFVNFSIVEGQRYTFGNVAIETSIPGLNADALTSTIRTGQGSRYSLAELQSTQEDMAYEATSQGYSFADVRPRIDRDEANGTLNITYLVDEGARVYVERIDISGNSKTRDAVIRRELDFGEGDPFNRSMLQRGKSNIEGLGFFNTVNVGIEQGSASDKVIINIVVEEGSSGDYGATAGYSTDDGVLGEVSITERNFLGRGQYVRAAVSASLSSQSYDFSFTEPRFMGLRMSSGFDVYHRVNSEDDDNVYGTTATGGQIRFGMPITRDINGTVFTGLEHKVIEDADSPNSAIVNDGDEFNKAWIGYTLIYNGLDDTKKPTEGLYATFTQKYVGWDHNYLHNEAKARYFMPLLEDSGIIGSIRGQAGIIVPFGDDVNPVEAFNFGPSFVRGFQSSGMGPRLDSGANPEGSDELVGSTMYAGLSVEVEFPVPMLPESYGLTAAVWADAGWIGGQGNDFGNPVDADSTDNPFKASVGGSIIWDSPFGPLRGDVGYVVSKATGDKTQLFQLTMKQLL